MRALFALLLLAVAVPLPAGNVTELTGTFQGIEQGDYAYFQLKTDAGEAESLMILQTDASLDEFVEHADTLIGTKVAVQVEDRVENIPEAGGPTAVRVITHVERLGAGPTVGAMAATPAPASHCTPTESVVFACASGKKLISICASRSLTATKGYVRYRYGPPGAVELEWPDPSDTTRNHIAAATLMFSGGGGAYMRFLRRDHDYVVYTAIGKGWGEKSGVAVERFGTVVANPQCDGVPTSELGPELFETAGIAEDDQGFELPESVE